MEATRHKIPYRLRPSVWAATEQDTPRFAESAIDAQPPLSAKLSLLPKLFRYLFAARVALIAENLFLGRQLALFQERKIKPRRASKTTKLILVAFSLL